MIYLSISTRNRYHHLALTLLTLFNSRLPECFINLIDDGSTEKIPQQNKLVSNLVNDGLIHRYDTFESPLGEMGMKSFLWQRFHSLSNFEYHIHLDDDFILGEDLIRKVKQDYASVGNCGFLHIFADPRLNSFGENRGFKYVEKIFPKAYIVSKETLIDFENPFDKETKQECSNFFADQLLERKQRIFVKSPYYKIQATDGLMQRCGETGRLTQVPGYDVHLLDAMIREGNFASFVGQANKSHLISLDLT